MNTPPGVLVVRVKYCGGCNPSYDRTALVKRIQDRFPPLRFVYADTPPDVSVDFVLVVCGCPVRCANYAELHGLLGKFVVASQDDFSAACLEIERAFGLHRDA
ncbi:MAG: hypothetical protein LBQ90_11795 [Synergistaceae bacterium]|jgi:3-hydroxyacyl-[acyl-carrier-protein] dehydratase|nr:hypothetical protein [Synergistaceae bacterium]